MASWHGARRRRNHRLFWLRGADEFDTGLRCDRVNERDTNGIVVNPLCDGGGRCETVFIRANIPSWPIPSSLWGMKDLEGSMAQRAVFSSRPSGPPR